MRDRLRSVGVPVWSVLRWIWGPLVFLVSDLDLTPSSLVASLTASVLLTGSVVLPLRLVEREGRLRGLLLSALTGSVVGILLGGLQAGFWFDESWEVQGLGSWMLAGALSPPAFWLLSRLMVLGVRAPRNLLAVLRRGGLRPAPAVEDPARPAPTSRTNAPSRRRAKKPSKRR